MIGFSLNFINLQENLNLERIGDMKYLVADFNIACAAELMQTARDLVADLAGEAGFESFEDTPEGIRGYVQTDALDKQTLDGGIADFPMPDVHITYTICPAEDKNWNASWEASGFDPVIVDRRIIICDAKRPIPDTDNMTPIFIDACQAFGTGTHQTTRMIVSALLSLDLDGRRVLDCGCGTGILGIAASKMGAKGVVGYDIDEWSVENTEHNCQINHVENMEVLHGDALVLSHVSGVFDVVLANINRNILLHDLETFKDIMASGALLVMSGFYEADIPMLLAKATELKLKEVGRKTDGEWACLMLQLA